MKHPYRIHNRSRKAAYILLLGISSCIAAALVPLGIVWLLPGVLLASYLVLFLVHERLLWRSWRRWHGVPFLGGTWDAGAEGDELRISQDWTSMEVSGRLQGQAMESQLAGFVRAEGGIELLLVLRYGDGDRCFRLRAACGAWDACVDADGRTWRRR